MAKDRREILAVGELALFLATWLLGTAAIVDNYYDRSGSNAGNDIAATSSSTSFDHQEFYD